MNRAAEEDAADRAGDVEIAGADVDSGALQSKTQRDFFLGLLARLDLFQSLGDVLLAARARLSGSTGAELAAATHRCDVLNALVLRPFAGNIRPGEREHGGGDGDRRHAGHENWAQIAFKHSFLPAGCRCRRRLPIQPARGRGARSRRSIRRDPRSADGRCRSNGDGR